jgi:uncharacterized protein YbaP (TraB family)
VHLRPLAHLAIPAVLAALLALGCASPPPQAAADSGQLVFWEIRMPGSQAPTAHLLGTVHYGRDAFAFDPVILAALDEADALVLELDLDLVEEEAVGAVLARSGFYLDGRTLYDVLTPDTMAKLERYLAERSIEATTYLRMEPWLVLTILQDAALQEEGYASDQGIELNLASAAKDTPVRGLETIEEQLGALDGLPIATQEALILQLVDAPAGSDSASETANTIHLLLEAWEKGDLELLEGIVLADRDDPALAPYYEALYYARNRRMAERLAQQLDGGERLFVAVGSAHMVGRDNVVLGLRERGFDVRRVPRSAALVEEE